MNFNSRPSARGDGETALVNRAARHISIHAPPRGATPSVQKCNQDAQISIHAPPRGATTAATGKRVAAIFQFTPLREGRLLIGAGEFCLSDFNSRPSARGDEEVSSCSKSQYPFQFTPLREGRHGGMAIRTAGLEFQFTPLREGRRKGFGLRSPVERDFNSRPSARGDAASSGRQLYPLYFNSRPSARGDVREVGHLEDDYYFNSRPSARGDLRDLGRSRRSERFQFTPLREGRHEWKGKHSDADISIHAPPRGAT